MVGSRLMDSIYRKMEFFMGSWPRWDSENSILTSENNYYLYHSVMHVKIQGYLLVIFQILSYVC